MQDLGNRMPSVMLKVRCGNSIWIKPNGSVGTAGKGVLMSEDVTFTLASTQDQTLFQSVDFSNGIDASKSGLSGSKYIARRLTPTECERLQGMPDGYTDLSGSDPNRLLELMPQVHEMDARAKALLERKVRRWCRETPDGPRYKAIGNSFAVPCVRWIFKRIDDIDKMGEQHDVAGGGLLELQGPGASATRGA